jgi:hypothetical protein
MLQKKLLLKNNNITNNLKKIYFLYIYYKMSSLPLNFYFTTQDPEFVTTTTVVPSTPGNYIAHVFVRAPLYDFTDIF